MKPAYAEQLSRMLVQWSSASRLYELAVGDKRRKFSSGELLVEAFLAVDTVYEVGTRDVIVLSTSAHADLDALLGQPASLEISLADGSRARFAGEIDEVAMLGSDGGFARYRLRISPWAWRLGQVRNSRVWQDKTVMQIVDAVFAPYRPQARWRWSAETGRCLAHVPPRSYCCQYRESDLDFVRRLLAEEGLGWRFEQTDDGPGMVLFADSTQLAAVPEDISSKRDAGVRYHGANAVERQDTVQTLIEQRRLQSSLSTLLSANGKSKQVVAASSPSFTARRPKLPELESFDVPGQHAFDNLEQAKRYADLHMERQEALEQQWQGSSTLRTLRAGTRLTITGIPRRERANDASFTILRVISVGLNNLPPPAQQALAELFGPIPELLEGCAAQPSGDSAPVIALARLSGYANSFDAIPAQCVWRPQLPGSGGRSDAKRTALGSQTAIVIGPDGGDRPVGANELYCDRLGRVRIRFHWQEERLASCWVRVAQRLAGGGMGSQFLPRIGQEVLVQFLENDIDRPIIVGALYNGQGEGGIRPTPGGRINGQGQLSVFEGAHDHSPSGQGNLVGGNGPVWHGASAAGTGHRNGAAQWGIRSKEFGGAGYNQLLFDDTDGQGRVQLRCTHAYSELNLGHLIHAADNYRGSFRGLGAELRTDDYGAVRAGAGLLISSYGIVHSAASRDPAGENAAGVAMLTQVVALAKTFSEAAVTHQTVALASHVGADKPGASLIDGEAAPLQGLLKAVSGMVGTASLDAARSDAVTRGTASGADSLPHTLDPIIAIAAKDGFGASAGQSLQIASGETVTLASGKNTQFAGGGQLQVHAGQAIGVLGGAIGPGVGGIGLQLIAAQDTVDIQAQAGELKVQARDEVNVISANAHIDWAAAKRISLSTAGGANITIEGGNITVQCPGKITVHAGKKSFLGPARLPYELPALPNSICVACLKKSLEAGPAFTMVE